MQLFLQSNRCFNGKSRDRVTFFDKRQDRESDYAQVDGLEKLMDAGHYRQ